MKSDESPREHEASMTPMRLQQRRVQNRQRTVQQFGMDRLLLQKVIDCSGIFGIAGARRAAPYVDAIAALGKLEALQRTNQRAAQILAEIDAQMPRNIATFLCVSLEIV